MSTTQRLQATLAAQTDAALRDMAYVLRLTGRVSQQIRTERLLDQVAERADSSLARGECRAVVAG